MAPDFAKNNPLLLSLTPTTTHSEDSICSLEGMIIMKQLSRMVVMMMREKSGCTRMWMATRRTGLKGDSTHSASAAEKRKMSFPFEMTMNVCNDRRSQSGSAWKMQLN